MHKKLLSVLLGFSLIFAIGLKAQEASEMKSEPTTSVDSLIEKREALIQNHALAKSELRRITTKNLQTLNTLQEEVLNLDNILIDEHLIKLIEKNQEQAVEIQKLKANLDVAEAKVKEDEELMFYGLIGAGAVLLLFLLFLILFIAANSKKSKFKSRLIKMQKLQKEHQKELDNLQSDQDAIIQKIKRENLATKERMEKETKAQEQKAQQYLNEKQIAEKQLKEIRDKEDMMIMEIKTMKDEYENKSIQLDQERTSLNEKINFLEEELETHKVKMSDKERELDQVTQKANEQKTQLDETLEKIKAKNAEIEKINLDFDQAKNEREQLELEVNHVKELLEKEKQEKAKLNEQLKEQEKVLEADEEISRLRSDIDMAKVSAEKSDLHIEMELMKKMLEQEQNEKRMLEKQLQMQNRFSTSAPQHIPTPKTYDFPEIEELSKEKDYLEKELSSYKSLLDKEVNARKKIESELRSFINELRHFRQR